MAKDLESPNTALKGWKRTMYPSIMAVYDFIENPGGFWGWLYHYCLIISNVLYMIIILMETTDGPNQYENRENQALYKELPTYDGYLAAKLTLSIPLFLHCIGRLLLSLTISQLFAQYSNDPLGKFLSKSSNILLCLWFWPLLIDSCSPGLWPRDIMAVYHGIDFLRHLQILQTFKQVPSFLVVKETYRRVIKLLPIPFFLFFVFNIFCGVILYLIDPCFNYSTCPFNTLFDAVFFSIVTVTTSKFHPSFLPPHLSLFYALINVV